MKDYVIKSKFQINPDLPGHSVNIAALTSMMNEIERIDQHFSSTSRKRIYC